VSNSAESTQHTLTGEEADERERPETMLWCDECMKYILRSNRHDHPHDLAPDPHTETDDADDDRKDPDEIVGEVFDVTIKMEFTANARVVAPNEGRVKEKAEEMRIANREDVNGNVPEPRYTMSLHQEADAIKPVARRDEDLAERMEGWPW